MFVQHPEFRDYLIFDDGKVVSLRSGKWKELKSGKSSNGYLQVVLSKDKKQFTKSVHRLVMEVFNGKSKLHIDHINGVKVDNRLENLEYVTQKENMQRAWKNGLNNSFGENHGQSKLTEDQVLEILSLKGQLTQQKIGKKFNIHSSLVSYIHRGKIWKHLNKENK